MGHGSSRQNPSYVARNGIMKGANRRPPPLTCPLYHKIFKMQEIFPVPANKKLRFWHCSSVLLVKWQLFGFFRHLLAVFGPKSMNYLQIPAPVKAERHTVRAAERAPPGGAAKDLPRFQGAGGGLLEPVFTAEDAGWTRDFPARQGAFSQEYFVYCKKTQRSMAEKDPSTRCLRL